MDGMARRRRRSNRPLRGDKLSPCRSRRARWQQFAALGLRRRAACFSRIAFYLTFCHSERSRGISYCFSELRFNLRDASTSPSMTSMKIRSWSILSLSILSAVSVFAQQTPQSVAEAELPSLLAIYKDVHSHPELSGHEEHTSALIAKELRAAGCQVTE